MATFTDWPTAAEVQQVLEGAGAWEPIAGIGLGSMVDVAIAEFEGATGFQPFLNKDRNVTARTFDPPGPVRVPYATLMGGGQVLFLDGGLLAEPESITLNGVELLANRQYWCKSYKADRPIEAIRFNARVFSRPGGLEITGVWGFSDMVPPMAHRAVLLRAARAALPLLAAYRRTTAEADAATQVKAVQTGPVRTEYAAMSAEKSTGFEALGAAYETEWRAAVNHYRPCY